VYDITAPDLDNCTPNTAMKKLIELDRESIKNGEQHNKNELEKKKFKWICCDTTVTTGSGAGGCKKGKHGFGEQIGEGQQRDGRRLDQTMIKQWEEECQRNQEYNERWLLLLENRS